MSTKKIFATTIVAICGLFANSAFASKYVACDGCNQLQMANMAIAQGVGRYVVGNVTGNTVQAFRVYQSPREHVVGFGIQPLLMYQDDGNITAAEITAFAKLVSFYNTAPIGYQKQINLYIVAPGQPTGVPHNMSAYAGVRFFPALNGRGQPAAPMSGVPVPGGGSVSYPYPGVNAYSVVNSGVDQNHMLTWLSQTSTFRVSNIIDNVISALSVFNVADASHAPATAFTIYFQDGSHIGAYVDGAQSPPQLVVNEGSAVDSHGNPIPATKLAVAGSGVQHYRFGDSGNSTDRPNMNHQIYLLGVSPPSLKVTYFDCQVIGDSTVECVREN